MKRKLILLVIAIVAAVTPMTGYASEKRFLAEVADLSGTKYTNIDADILRRSDNKVTFSNISGLGIGLEKVKSFEVIECDNAESIAKLEDFAKMLIKKNKLEVITANNTEDSRDTVYGIIPADGSKIPYKSHLLVETITKDSYTLIYIAGTIDWAMMDNYFKNKNKK